MRSELEGSLVSPRLTGLERSKLTLIVPLAVVGIEPESWDTWAYPADTEQPKVTAEMVNGARLKRGQAAIPEEDVGQDDLPLATLRELALNGGRSS